MSKKDAPAPNTIAGKVIKHLQEANDGRAVDAAQVAKLTGCSLTNVSTNLRAAADDGFLSQARAAGTDGRKYVWSLGPKAGGSATTSKPRKTKGKSKDEPPLDISTYEDGDVLVIGGREAETGGTLYTLEEISYLVQRMTMPHLGRIPF
jgi:hypothetical protein